MIIKIVTETIEKRRLIWFEYLKRSSIKDEGRRRLSKPRETQRDEVGRSLTTGGIRYKGYGIMDKLDVIEFKDKYSIIEKS